MLNEFKNSVGYFDCCESSISESSDKHLVIVPGNKLVAISLISSAFLLVEATITRVVISERLTLKYF